MRLLRRVLGIVAGTLGVMIDVFEMPSLEATPIGSRCGQCRYRGPFTSRPEGG